VGKEFATFLLLVVLCVIVMALNSRFMSTANLQNTVRLIGAFGIFSLGLGLVITTGGIDLSVGLAFALLGVVLSIMLTEWHLAWPVAVLTVIARRGPRRLPRSADHSPGSAAFHRHALRAAAVSRACPIHRR
jgi:ribose/xylose/arabinose/galactoside ABC-type transport system permease subunit